MLHGYGDPSHSQALLSKEMQLFFPLASPGRRGVGAQVPSPSSSPATTMSQLGGGSPKRAMGCCPWPKHPRWAPCSGAQLHSGRKPPKSGCPCPSCLAALEAPCPQCYLCPGTQMLLCTGWCSWSPWIEGNVATACRRASGPLGGTRGDPAVSQPRRGVGTMPRAAPFWAVPPVLCEPQGR